MWWWYYSTGPAIGVDVGKCYLELLREVLSHSYLSPWTYLSSVLCRGRSGLNWVVVDNKLTHDMKLNSNNKQCIQKKKRVTWKVIGFSEHIHFLSCFAWYSLVYRLIKKKISIARNNGISCDSLLWQSMQWPELFYPYWEFFRFTVWIQDNLV